jgi:hypothetical protein
MVNSFRILLCAYNFPPLISPQTLRWFYLIRELSKLGYKIDILTIKMPERFQELLDNIPEAIKIHRTFPGPMYFLTFRYSWDSSQNIDKKSLRNFPFIWNIVSKTYFATYRIINTLMVPDIYTEWFPFALRKGYELLKTNRYDAIISSSEPRICHLVGYFLKKKSGIPWIADYGDPWVYPLSTMTEGKYKKNIIKKVENKILKEMDTVTVSTEGAKEFYLTQYPFLRREKISVISQGFDPDEFAGVKPDNQTKFRIVYCGSLYKGLRDPNALFKAVSEINNNDIEVLIAGRINEFIDAFKKEGSNPKIRYLGFLNHRRCLELEKGATVLLHIGNISEIQVPGKIYEYLGAKRPILAIRGTERDVSADLTLRHNRGIVVGNNTRDIRQGIMKLYNLWKENILDKNFNLRELNDFFWLKSAKQLISIIDKS